MRLTYWLRQGSKSENDVVLYSYIESNIGVRDRLLQHGALKTYDLPNLAAMLGPEWVTIEEPVDARGQLVGVSDLVIHVKSDILSDREPPFGLGSSGHK